MNMLDGNRRARQGRAGQLLALLCVLLTAATTAVAGEEENKTAATETSASDTGKPPPDAWFEECSVAAGVSVAHRNRSFTNPYAHIMEGYTALGAAAVVADYNGDGFDDVFTTDSSVDGENRLYRNNGDFTFTDVAREAGVAAGNDAANATADALWFDYNNDGRPDLLVVRFGQNLLFENRGDGTFVEVSARVGLTRHLNCIVAIAFDYDRDGDLDLLLGNYFQPVNLFDPSDSRFFPESFETANNGGGVVLFRNNGAGEDGTFTFTDATVESGLVVSGWTLDLGHADADHDGDDDLYVAADFGTDSFFANNGDGTFTNTSEKAIGIDTKKGMNVDWADHDNDGLLAIYVTNITDEYMREGNFLWHNDGDLTFSDLGRETGTHNTGWGWGGRFFDYDNDGWLDIYVVNGWVSGNEENYVLDIFTLVIDTEVDLSDATNWPPMGQKTLSGYQRACLFRNESGGTLFRNEGARHGLDSIRDGRGVAVADFDNDGRLDLYVTNACDVPELYRNLLPSGAHWVQFLLTGTRSNRDAVGARLWLTAGGTTRVSFINGGNGFASQCTRRVHFGLADAAEVAELRIVWPSGDEQKFTNFKADRIYRITEGEKKLEPFSAAAAALGAPRREDETMEAEPK
ncbi:MAG: CRTAC1 family protein [bacterium]|nr:CRTAC1 family protein [bacterium]